METVDLVKYRAIKDQNPIYSDVISCSKKPVFESSRSTSVHETCHMISSELRRNKSNSNGFYKPSSKGVIVEQPKIKISDVAKYVPKNLRGIRYKLYFQDQLKYWNDSPLYIMEEWNCYTIGGLSGLTDYKLGISKEKTDMVSGTFEFKIYSIALYMCINNMDKNYDIGNFRNFFSYLSELSFNIFNEGRLIEEFKSQSSNRLFDEFCNSQEGKTFMNFLNSIKPEKDYDFKRYL